MEIVKRGIPPSERVLQGECTICASVLRAKQQELRYDSDSRESYYSGVCPVCSNLVYFNTRVSET